MLLGWDLFGCSSPCAVEERYGVPTMTFGRGPRVVSEHAVAQNMAELYGLDQEALMMPLYMAMEGSPRLGVSDLRSRSSPM